MFIIKHVYSRIGSTLKTRVIIFETENAALEYMRELRHFETVLLFKKDQRKGDRRTMKGVIYEANKTK